MGYFLSEHSVRSNPAHPATLHCPVALHGGPNGGSHRAARQSTLRSRNCGRSAATFRAHGRAGPPSHAPHPDPGASTHTHKSARTHTLPHMNAPRLHPRALVPAALNVCAHSVCVCAHRHFVLEALGMGYFLIRKKL